MMTFKQLPEFEKELEKLLRRYPSLRSDIETLERVLEVSPTGFGKNFITLHHEGAVKIVKTRLACKSLRKNSIRLIYAYHDEIFEFMYIEIYYKGDKTNEDRERIKDYIQKNF